MAAGEIRAGRAFVELMARDASLSKGLENAQRRMRAFAAAAQQIGANLGALGAAITAPLALATQQFVRFGSELQDASDRTGAGTRFLSGLKFAAEQTGASLEQAEGALRAMQRTIGEAADGSAAAGDALAGLGLNVQTLAGLRPEEQFDAIAAALRGIEDPTRRAAAAMSVLGKGGAALLPAISEIDELRARAEALGVVMDPESARAADELGDAFGELKAAAVGLSAAVGSALKPTLQATAQGLTHVTGLLRDFSASHPELVTALGAASAAMTAFAATMYAVGSATSVADKALRGLAATTALLAGVKAAVVSLGAAVTAALGPMVALQLAAIAVAGAGLAVWALLSSDAVDDLGEAAGRTGEELSRLRQARVDQAAAERIETRRTADAEKEQRRIDLVEDAERRLNQLSISLIADRAARERAAIDEKYDHEAARARKQGADANLLVRIEQARRLELHKLEQDEVRAAAEAQTRFAGELHELKAGLIDDEDARALAQIRLRYATEVELARQANDLARVAQLERLRDAELQLAYYRQGLELQREQERAAAGDAARRESIEELRLRLAKQGIELQRALLGLERQRAIAAAERAGQDVSAVSEEFELRRALLELEESRQRVREVERTGTFGSFNPAALVGLASAGVAAGDRALSRTAGGSDNLGGQLDRLVEGVRHGQATAEGVKELVRLARSGNGLTFGA